MKKIREEENIHYAPQYRSPIAVIRDMEKRMAQVKTLMIALEKEIVSLSIELQEAQQSTLRNLPVTLHDN